MRKDADIMQWAIKWAADLITNYQVGEDGRTAFERRRGHVFTVKGAPLAEHILYLRGGAVEQPTAGGRPPRS